MKAQFKSSDNKMAKNGTNKAFHGVKIKTAAVFLAVTPLFVPLLLGAQQAGLFIQLLPPKAPTMTQAGRLHRILPLSSRRMCLF